ncbi:MAG TPA: hypothetical protein VH682_00150 [Gemmataceae bacterium]|jgi:hypothetical protein
MIGQTIEFRPSLPLGAILWLLLAVLLDVLAAVQGNVHLAVGSLFPWLFALFLWRTRTRPFTARFTETTLEVDEPPVEVPYANLQGLLAPRRPANPFKAGPRSYRIQVIHTDGVLRIPARLNVPSDEVFSFLYRQFSPSGSRDVPATLVDFLRRKEREFGREHTWTYQARAHRGQTKSHPRLMAFFLALLVAGGGWLAWGIVRGQGGWIAGGIFGLVWGGLFSFLFWLSGRQSLAGVRKGRQAGLVIAPDGLALAQGDMVGQLRWDEVRDVKLGKSAASFQFTMSAQSLRGIVIKVEGAAIVIVDVYDRPLALIYQNICHYWRGQSLDDGDREAMSRLSAAPGTSLPPSSEGITPRQ